MKPELEEPTQDAFHDRAMLSVHRHRVAPAWLFVVLAAMSGRATQTAGRQDLMKFLTPGTTTRADAVLHLGEPSRSYEGSRILTYRVNKEDGEYFIVEPLGGWYGVRYTLVLVFDEQGILQKYSLVPVRSP